ncbi:hypothetical protein MMA231_04127 (plasmid) [Asticcacaulis sp. MM231]|uniref:hypothetical protein n=1 Tax=Asticcacaulis sp. MM231 TaxID=3157666 RepID=UPI0032D5B04E
MTEDKVANLISRIEHVVTLKTPPSDPDASLIILCGVLIMIVLGASTIRWVIVPLLFKLKIIRRRHVHKIFWN